MSAVKFTPQQQNAIDSRGGALIVSAAAGSGKTAVLVQRVIEQVTGGENPIDLDRLLIVTFTNAAASEMRAKIADALLKQLAEKPESGRLRRQLALLHSARIQTVHSFCLELVRQHFDQCDVSPNFRLLDTAESELLRETAMEEFLEEEYAEASAGFMAMIENFAEERGDHRVQAVISELYEKLRSHADPAGWRSRMEEQLQASCDQPAAEQEWCRRVMEDCAEGLKCRLELLTETFDRLGQFPELFEKYAPAFQYCLATGQHLLAALEATEWDNAWQVLQRYEKPAFSAAPRGTDADLKEEMGQARDFFCEYMEKMRTKAILRPESRLREEAQKSLPVIHGLFEAVGRFEEKYQQLKQRRGVLDFSDLEHLALKLLLTPQGEKTLLAHELAAQIDEILVDEYQDTNEIQDKIFAAVRGEGKGLFMVGDVKQSIYRFRLAEPEIFVGKYYSYEDYAPKAVQANKRIMLNQNFRSRSEVLDFVNFVFENLMSREFGGIAYDDREKLVVGADYQGACPAEVYVLDLARDKSEETQAPEKVVYEAEFVARAIEQNLAETQVTDRETGELRSARPEDIAVLFSSFTSRAPIYEEAISARGIPCAFSAEAAFFETTEILVMRSLLAVIDNPRQDIPLIAVLRSPLFLFTADELAAIRIAMPKAEFYDALCASNLPAAKAFLAELESCRAYAPDFTVAELIAMLYTKTGAKGIFEALDHGEARRENLQKFYQLALRFEQNGSRGLFAFLQYLEQLEKEAGDAAEPAGNAVKLMSVHKSKGLEFPIVILPDLSKNFNTDDLKSAMLMHKDLGVGLRLRDEALHMEYKTQKLQAIALRHEKEAREEELRKLYVAMTRAKEKLILTVALPDAAKTLKGWLRFIRDGKLLPQMVAEQASAAFWVCGPLLLHPAGGVLRELAGEIRPEEQPRGGGLYCEVVPYAPPQEVETVTEEETETSRQLTLEMPYYRAIQQFAYPHQAATELPSKLTPAGLKLQRDEEAALLEAEEKGPVIRLFPSGSDAAKLGTLAHLCMQYCDFEQAQTAEGAAKQLEEIKKKFPEEKLLEKIPPQFLTEFAAGELGRLAAQSSCLREYQFSALLPAGDMIPGAPMEEEILLNGVIDLLIFTESGMILVDFKSDTVREGGEAEHARRYETQLKLYAKAAEEILQRPVERKIVWFLSTAAGIEL